jgi:hypothetical protein
MSETLQRTEQVVTVAELREMLDDEDEKSFTDLTSKGVAQVRDGALASRAGRPLALLAESKLVG